MAEKKQPQTVTPNKLAMSKALGAAFLNHQVEQLEKSVSGLNAPSSGTWRRRQMPQSPAQVPSATNMTARKPPMASGVKIVNRRHGEDSQTKNKALTKEQSSGVSPPNLQDVRGRKKSDEDKAPSKENRKDADVVVVDASVLVHALYQLKKWCRDGREEIVIVPLEALNTLDLLKKGTSPLAQRARTASRVLEAQVGTNPRIRVQQDDAFVLWDKIGFQEPTDPAEQGPVAKSPGLPPYTSPEWVRRTICCAQWEVEHGAEETAKGLKKPAPGVGHADSTPPKVVLAVLASNATSEVTSSLGDMKLSAAPAQTNAPVPLPAPHANKYEPRSSGTLVAHWAARAHIDMLPIEPAAGPAEDDAVGRSKRTSRSRRPSDGGAGNGGHHGRGHGHGVGLVERPPAVKAMMDMVAQPSKVVRVLARGEKLDPDT